MIGQNEILSVIYTHQHRHLRHLSKIHFHRMKALPNVTWSFHGSFNIVADTSDDTANRRDSSDSDDSMELLRLVFPNSCQSCENAFDISQHRDREKAAELHKNSTFCIVQLFKCHNFSPVSAAFAASPDDLSRVSIQNFQSTRCIRKLEEREKLWDS